MYGSRWERGENYHCVGRTLPFLQAPRWKPHRVGAPPGCTFTTQSAWEYTALGGPWELERMGNLGVFALVPVDVLGNETKRELLMTPVKTNTHRLRCSAVCLGNGALVFALTCRQQWPWEAQNMRVLKNMNLWLWVVLLELIEELRRKRWE